MTTPIQNLRSNVDSKRPTASGLAFGQIAINYNENDPAIYLRGDSDALLKIAPVYIASGAPNATPASGGTSGNSIGEQWLDISTSPATLKLWDGSNWLSPGATSIASGVIVDANINASAAIADTKLDTISTAGKVSNSATTATDANTSSAIVARDASGDFSAGTITADLTGNADTATKLNSTRTFEVTGDVTGTVSSDLTSGASIATSIASGVIVDADVNASAAIAGTKIDPDFGSQTIETTGVINAGSGTEAAPAITVGTTDNGLYSPGTDEVAISTNGTGRLFIDSSGNVGINRTSPAQNLDVASTNNIAYALDGWALAGKGDSSDILFGGILSSQFDTLKLYTSGSERMRIDSSGNVGLGTSSPDLKLEVSGGQNQTANQFTDLFRIAANANNDAAGAEVQLNFAVSPSDTDAANRKTRIQSQTADGTGRTLAINPAGGNVGIGTTPNTSTRLHVKSGANDGNPVLRLEAATNNNLDFRQTGSVFDINVTASDPLSFSIGSSEKARIDSSGRLLVGTSSAPNSSNTAKIQAINSASAGLILGRDDSSVTTDDTLGYIMFMGNVGGSYDNCARIRARADGTHASGDKPTYLEFSTTADGASSPTERMRIRSDGRILANSGGDGIWHGSVFSRLTANVDRGFVIVNTGSGIGPLPCDASGSTVDNAEIFGFSGSRWSVIYAATGTINTSDANEKQDIRNISSSELAAAQELKTMIKAFRFKDAVEEKGEDARIHFGVIAQEVQEMFGRHGLDATNYGFWCSDTFYELDGKPVFADEEGNYPDGAVAKTRLGIRYSELLAFVIAAL